MSRPVYSCEFCAQPFTPLPNNRNRQRCCGRQSCKRQRKRERQRKWHKARYGEDAAFRAAAKNRVRRHRRLRKGAAAAAPAVASVEHLERVAHAVLGLAVQLGEDDDPLRAAALMASWADRGARLGIGPACGP